MQRSRAWLTQCFVLLGLTFATSAIAQTNIYPANGSVGIGTTAPDSLLEIGNPNIGNSVHSVVGGGYAGLFENAYTGYGGTSRLFWVRSANQNPDSYHLYVEGSNSPELVVKGDGNVGIGTTTPASPLHVVGGFISGSLQVPNVFTIAPSGGSGGYSQSGVSMYLDALSNRGVVPVSGLWSTLDNGGDGGVNYSGSLVFGTVQQGNAKPSEQARINGNGNFGIGTASPGSKLEVNGNISLTRSSGASITFADGTTQSTAWSGTLCGGDYAESVDVTGERSQYEPGDVLALDSTAPGNVSKVAEPYSSLVAGIYSTKPGIVGRRQTSDPKTSNTEVPMAMVGVVPTKVSTENGPIKIGDLLVTSSTLGHAMKGTDRNRMFGTVIGKAMGELNSGTGVIEVLVSLQ